MMKRAVLRYLASTSSSMGSNTSKVAELERTLAILKRRREDNLRAIEHLFEAERDIVEATMPYRRGQPSNVSLAKQSDEDVTVDSSSTTSYRYPILKTIHAVRAQVDELLIRRTRAIRSQLKDPIDALDVPAVDDISLALQILIHDLESLPDAVLFTEATRTHVLNSFMTWHEALLNKVYGNGEENHVELSADDVESVVTLLRASIPAELALAMRVNYDLDTRFASSRVISLQDDFIGLPNDQNKSEESESVQQDEARSSELSFTIDDGLRQRMRWSLSCCDRLLRALNITCLVDDAALTFGDLYIPDREGDAALLEELQRTKEAKHRNEVFELARRAVKGGFDAAGVEGAHDAVRQLQDTARGVLANIRGNDRFGKIIKKDLAMERQKRIKMDDAGRRVVQFRGSRKRSGAVVRVRELDSIDLENDRDSIRVNGKCYTEYFPTLDLRHTALFPLVLTNLVGHYSVDIQVSGGGMTGQAGAISLGLSRCLETLVPEASKMLRSQRLLTRDPREVERKKPGGKKARKRFTWVKR